MLNSVCQNDPLHLPCVHILPCSVTRRNCDKAYSFQQVLFCEHSAQVNIFYMMSNSCDISLYQLSCACYPTTEKVTAREIKMLNSLLLHCAQSADNSQPFATHITFRLLWWLLHFLCTNRLWCFLLWFRSLLCWCFVLFLFLSRLSHHIPQIQT